MSSVLEIRGLRAGVSGRVILDGIDLTIRSGEVHAVMGPNGSGKSTLSHVIMGKPGYEVLSGQVLLDGVDLLTLDPWQRAVAGMFLAMQYPIEVPGVQLDAVLSEALAARGRSAGDIGARLRLEAERIGFDDQFLQRPLNVDLSGGEKKRNETVQLAVLEPRFAILDELDSGLDVDALAACAKRVEAATHENNLGVLAITHYNRLLEFLRPDRVHILVKGALVASGGPELATQLEIDGYAQWAPEGNGRASGTGGTGSSKGFDPFLM